jgi:hypothetical protein
MAGQKRGLEVWAVRLLANFSEGEKLALQRYGKYLEDASLQPEICPY